MRCRRVLRQTDDFVLKCSDTLFPNDYLFCGTKRKDVVSSLVYFGSYGSNESTKQVSEYGSACANISISSKILSGTAAGYIKDDVVVMTIPNVAPGTLTITFGRLVRSLVIARAYIAHTDINVPLTVPSSQSFTSKTMTVPDGATYVTLYFTKPAILQVYLVTISDCEKALVAYTKRVHAAKWAPDKITFASKQEGVASSLTQRLNIIEGELWYNVKEGLPLFNKQVTITSMDAWLIRTIMKHPDVISILTFTSTLNDHKYAANTHILSKYGELDLQI